MCLFCSMIWNSLAGHDSSFLLSEQVAYLLTELCLFAAYTLARRRFFLGWMDGAAWMGLGGLEEV